MKVHGRSRGIAPSILNSAADGDEWSASRLGLFTLGTEPRYTLQMGTRLNLPRIEPKSFSSPTRNLVVILPVWQPPLRSSSNVCLRRNYCVKPSSICPWGIQSNREKPYLAKFCSSGIRLSTESHLQRSQSTSRLKTLQLWFLSLLSQKKIGGQGTHKRNKRWNLILARVPDSFAFHTTFVVSLCVVLWFIVRQVLRCAEFTKRRCIAITVSEWRELREGI
jgi:hypothetical protein